MKTLVAAGALALASALAPPQAAARTGAPPLDPVLEGQLERWLGADDQTFENIYTRQGAGDTSRDFHAAADDRGPSFTLRRVSDAAGRAWLVSGLAVLPLAALAARRRGRSGSNKARSA